MAYSPRQAQFSGNTSSALRKRQALKAASKRSERPAHLCQALTRAGNPCKNHAEAWHRYCGPHAHLRVAAPRSTEPDVPANTVIHKGPRLSLADAIARAKQIEADERSANSGT